MTRRKRKNYFWSQIPFITEGTIDMSIYEGYFTFTTNNGAVVLLTSTIGTISTKIISAVPYNTSPNIGSLIITFTDPPSSFACTPLRTLTSLQTFQSNVVVVTTGSPTQFVINFGLGIVPTSDAGCYIYAKF